MKLWLKILIGLAIAGILSTLAVYIFVFNKPHPNYEKEKAAFILPAKDLYDAFKQNKTQAGSKYNGQVIEVDGTLTKIESSDSLAVISFVFEQGDFGDQGVRVTMLADFKDKTSKLSAGAPIKLKGYCTGYNDTDVILDKVSIVE